MEASPASPVHNSSLSNPLTQSGSPDPLCILEDEEGLVNLIVRPNVYERYRGALRNAPLLLVEGRLQREGHALSVLVFRAVALDTEVID